MSPKELTDPRIYMTAERTFLAWVRTAIAFIVLGLLILILGAINFYRTVKQVDKGVYRTHTWLYKMYGAIIFITCLVLTFYVLKVI